MSMAVFVIGFHRLPTKLHQTEAVLQAEQQSAACVVARPRKSPRVHNLDKLASYSPTRTAPQGHQILAEVKHRQGRLAEGGVEPVGLVELAFHVLKLRFQVGRLELERRLVDGPGQVRGPSHRRHHLRSAWPARAQPAGRSSATPRTA